MSFRSPNNKVVHGLWVGNDLTNLELLTIHSFVKHGHEFHLWLYETLDVVLPDHVIIEDAHEIIPREQIFYYKNATAGGIGKGSYAGFSDIFRYKLLYEKGGWWIDMDVTCLKPFDVQEDFFFPKEITMSLTGKLIKAPPKSQLMKECYDSALETIDENNTNWYKPIDILISGVEKHGLESFIVEDFINWDSYVFVDVLRNTNHRIPAKFSAFHWSNEQWRHRDFDKNQYSLETTYGSLLQEFEVVSDQDRSSVSFDHSPMKKIQLLVFRFLFDRPRLLDLFKDWKNRISQRYDLWM